MTGVFLASLLLVAFLAGSIPFGLIVARAFHVSDLKGQGSGNIGATNVSRVLGFWPAGFLTFVLDVTKGAGPVLIMAYTRLPSALSAALPGAGDFAEGLPLIWIWLIGFAAILGHCFSPWVQFKGGKGVATGFGVLLALAPIPAAAGIVGFAYVFYVTRVGALASLAGLALTSVAYAILNPFGAHFIVGALMVLIIVIRHEKNLDSLLEGTENKFGP